MGDFETLSSKAVHCLLVQIAGNEPGVTLTRGLNQAIEAANVNLPFFPNSFIHTFSASDRIRSRSYA
jgi:hypothetical protein